MRFINEPTPEFEKRSAPRSSIQRLKVLTLVVIDRPLLRLRNEKHRSPNCRNDQQPNDDALPHNDILLPSLTRSQPPKPATTKRKEGDPILPPSPSGRGIEG